MRPLIFLSIIGVLSGVSLSGHAQGEASELLRRGVQLRREHRNEEALDFFRRAYAMSPTPVARAQLALAEQALGLWLQAERELDGALEEHRDPWVEANRQPLEKAREVIQQHLAWLTVSVDAADAEADLDGRPLAIGSEERVAAGPAVLNVRANAFLANVRRIVIAPGAHEHLAVALDPLETPLRRPQVAALGEGPPAHTFGAVERRAPLGSLSMSDGDLEATSERPSVVAYAGPLALGLLGAGNMSLGVYTGLQALQQKQARERLCDAGGCSPEAAVHYADARSLALYSMVEMGAAVAFIAAGTTWWVLDGRTHAANSGRPLAPAGPIVLGSLGLLSAGAATYFGARAYAEKGARDAACSDRGCTPAGLADDADARASANLATIGACVGGTLLAAGVAWWIVDRRSPARNLGWRPSPWLGPRQGGLSLEGRFQ